MTCGAHSQSVDAPHVLARFDSECPECGGETLEGEDVVYLVDGDWVCEPCARRLSPKL